MSGLCPICGNEMVPHDDEDYAFNVGGVAPETFEGVYCPTCEEASANIHRSQSMSGELNSTEPCEFCNGNGCPICDDSFVDEPDYPEEDVPLDDDEFDIDPTGRAPDENPLGVS